MSTASQRTTVSAEPEDIAAAWIAQLDQALRIQDADAVTELFLADGWWRDLLALTWDLRTLHGRDQIREVLVERLASTGVVALRPSEGRIAQRIQADADTVWIEAFFDFETEAANGRGVVRLMSDAAGAWRAWTVLTAMQELKGRELPRGSRRPTGPRHVPGTTRENWLDRRTASREYADREPAVLIVGGGQGGLALAANLGLMGVDTLVVERNARVGDNWRNRYHSLVLHDPVWADHLPYMPFPDSWPIYTPKDKLGDWFEHYAATMELDVWTSSELIEAVYDDESERWTVRLRRGNEPERSLHPAHVVLATGALGEPYVPAIEGLERFGGTVHHSSAHTGGENWVGRRAVVVGACNSGHDIAQDFYEHGAEVTLVQRSSTYVMSQEHGIPVLFGGLYYEGGPPVEDADLLNASFPLPLVLEFAQAQTAAIGELDRELIDGLERAGFRTDTGIDGGGLMSKALRRGGGYYIDVGCSGLIVDGKIKVKQGVGVHRLTETGLAFTDGTELEADVIVLATGYANMRETARRLLGDVVAERCKLVWDLDEEGEINSLWKDSGHPGLWFMGGPLVMARIYSRFLALQITAMEQGRIAHPSANTARSAT